jgi:hypothetical protein
VYPYGPQEPPQYPNPYGYGYDAPVGPPAVWPWYMAYAIGMAVLYLLVFALGVLLLFVGDKVEDQIQGGVMAIMGLPFAGIFGAAPLLPKKPWTWTYHLVLICLSLTSGCCLVISVPLLIHWIKPETKAFFGRS